MKPNKYCTSAFLQLWCNYQYVLPSTNSYLMTTVCGLDYCQAAPEEEGQTSACDSHLSKHSHNCVWPMLALCHNGLSQQTKTKNTYQTNTRGLFESPEPNIHGNLVVVLHDLRSKKTKPDAHIESTEELTQMTKWNLKSPAIELPKLATNWSHNFAVQQEEEWNHVVLKGVDRAEHSPKGFSVI